jgi:hypothetical protein
MITILGRTPMRLLLTLAELASQWPISIVAFGDRGPGASPGVPLRSADLVVTGGKAGLAPAGQVRLMSVFVHQLGEFFVGARIRTVRLANGQDVVRIEFTAPSRVRIARHTCAVTLPGPAAEFVHIARCAMSASGARADSES